MSCSVVIPFRELRKKIEVVAVLIMISPLLHNDNQGAAPELQLPP